MYENVNLVSKLLLIIFFQVIKFLNLRLGKIHIYITLKYYNKYL